MNSSTPHRSFIGLTGFAVLLTAAGLLRSPVQEPQEPAPLGAGVVARLDGVDISLAAYQDFLWRQTGKRALNQMVDDMLLEKACLRFGITTDEAAVSAAAEERLVQAAQGQPLDQFEADLRTRGFDLSMLRALFRTEALRVQRLDSLVRATRSATDARLETAFEARYGPGGIQVELRQILFMPHVLRAERIRGGADPKTLDQDELKAESARMAAEARARAAAGEDFGALAGAISHDQVSKKDGGRISSYRPGLYGPAFTAAVENLEPGELSPVVESGAGFHVIQLVARTRTQMAEVREQLISEVMAAEPDWQEREDLLAALRGKAKLEMW
jgi:parvulin-like peptidyl-prolyl isomerase